MKNLAFLTIILTILLSGSCTAGDRPGVFYDRDDVPRFKQYYGSDPLFADLRKELQQIDRSAERKFLRSEVRYNDQLFDILRVGNLAQQMALVYLFTGDRDAADLARECIETLMKFPRWDYFLEGGAEIVGLQRAPNSALAVSLVVETLGDLVSPAVRNGWLKTMAVRGTEPCYRSTYGMRYPDRVKGWTMDTTSTYFQHRPGDRGINLARWPIILDRINLKAIPASVLALSALTYRKYLGENDDTRRWLEQAVFSVSTFQDIYTPDGSYSEGVSYAHYTTLHLIQAIDALRRNDVADLSDLLNWNGYQTYLLEMTTPTIEDSGAIVNFSDAGKGANSSVSFWIARQTRDGQAQWFGENRAVGRDIWSVMYYDPTVAKEVPPQVPHLWHSNLDWIVGRTGYATDDLVVALRSGGPQNHEHADRNSLILKCFGEKLVVDPMRPPYTFTDPSWKMRLTMGHSAVLVDGQGHQYVDGREGTNASQASASIIRSGERQAYMFWTSDATPAYRLILPDVRSITRTVVMLKALPAVVVIDKVIKETTPSRIQARYYGLNNDQKGAITAGGSTFTIIRPNARLRGWSVSTSDVAATAGEPSIPADQARLFPFVDVSTVNPERETCLLTVLLPSAGDTVSGAVECVRNGSTFEVHIMNRGIKQIVRVFNSSTVPEFEIR